MKSYLNLLKHILENGQERTDRTGVGTIGVFGYQWRHNMADGFPLLTTKKVFFKGVVVELLWFLRGDTNIKYLHDHGVHIWDEWADENGELGPVYGKQWRKWKGDGTQTDQIMDLIEGLIHTPDSRRHIVSAWNVDDIPHMKLPPCHTLWQCHVQKSNDCDILNLHLYARSIDSFLGLPFNIASYALLLKLLSIETGMVPGELIISFGDLHIYKNHLNQVEEQLKRQPRQLPRISHVDPFIGLEDLEPENITLHNYNPHPAIKAPIAV